ncbi:hypothetical protein FOCC_FOCC017478, partial [Frankliniella occidentalis]
MTAAHPTSSKIRNAAKGGSIEIRRPTRPGSPTRLSLDPDERQPQEGRGRDERGRSDSSHSRTHLLEDDWAAPEDRPAPQTQRLPGRRARHGRWPRRLQVAALLVCSVLSSWLWRLLRAASAAAPHSGLEVSPSSRATDAESPAVPAPPSAEPPQRDSSEAPAPHQPDAPRGEQPQGLQEGLQGAAMWKERKAQAWRWVVDVLIYAAGESLSPECVHATSVSSLLWYTKRLLTRRVGFYNLLVVYQVADSRRALSWLW